MMADSQKSINIIVQRSPLYARTQLAEVDCSEPRKPAWNRAKKTSVTLIGFLRKARGGPPRAVDA